MENKMKKRKRLDYKLYKEAKERLFNNGYTIDNNMFFNTTDYNFKDFISLQIKDFKKEETKNSWELDDPMYYQTQKETNVYKDKFLIDILYGDWWRIGSKSLDKLLYLTVSTPYLRNPEQEYEIISLIRKHYFKTFGYGEEFYIEPKFFKIKTGKYKNFYELKNPFDNIKDTTDLIKEWIEKNKNSEEYNYYKNLIIKDNEDSLSIKEPLLSVYEHDINGFNITIPFDYNLTYPELFKLILENKIKRNNKEYSEDKIENLFENKKEFLLQFKPTIMKKYINKKNNKRKGKQK